MMARLRITKATARPDTRLQTIPTGYNVPSSLLAGGVHTLVFRNDRSQVSLQRHCAWIHADQAKSKKAIPVPLNHDAVCVLREQIGKHDIRVFTYNGKPVTRANNHAWRKALRRANIENFRWHDLRHTWASWHVQQGTPLHVLQELGGWSDYEMVRRYAHLSIEHLAGYANKLSRNESFGTNLTQSEKEAEKVRIA